MIFKTAKKECETSIATRLVDALFTNRSDPRATFTSRLQEVLISVKVVLAAADLARGATSLIWLLTLYLPNGSLLSLQAPIDPKVDPMAPSVSDAIAQRTIAYLRSHELL